MQKFNYQKGNKATGKIYIGLDHGYGNIKTAHRVFQTGIECYDEEPIVSTNYVKYRDKYYVIGESHLVYQGNKTETDDFYILTLAGLAEEMKYRGLHEADVVLAVGLPLAWVKTQAAEWRNYLMREKELDFSFRKERYKVHLCGLEIFPQGLAAVHNQGSMPGMNMLVDIGNGTMSILEIHDGRPMENSISTEVFGVHQCMEKIQKEVSKHSGVEVPEMLIEPLLRNGIAKETEKDTKKLKSAAIPVSNIFGSEEYVKVKKSDWEKIIDAFGRAVSRNKLLEKYEKKIVALEKKVSDVSGLLDKMKQFISNRGLGEAFAEFVKSLEPKTMKERLTEKQKVVKEQTQQKSMHTQEHGTSRKHNISTEL